MQHLAPKLLLAALIFVSAQHGIAQRAGGSGKAVPNAKGSATPSSTSAKIDACIKFNRCDASDPTIPNLEERRKQYQDEAMAKLYEKGPPSEEDLVNDYVATCTGGGQINECQEKLANIRKAQRRKDPGVAGRYVPSRARTQHMPKPSQKQK